MSTPLRATLATLLAFAFVGTARAQSTGGAPAASRPAAPAPAPEEKVSPAERETRVEHAVEQMHQQTGAMEKIVVQARSEKDIVKLDCVNAKLNQVKGLVRISEQAAAELKDANARKDDDAALSSFTKASIAGRKVGQLRQEAEQCIGQLAYYTDDKTRVDVEVPAGLPNSDPTKVPLPGPVDNRPSPASGF